MLLGRHFTYFIPPKTTQRKARHSQPVTIAQTPAGTHDMGRTKILLLTSNEVDRSENVSQTRETELYSSIPPSRMRQHAVYDSATLSVYEHALQYVSTCFSRSSNRVPSSAPHLLGSPSIGFSSGMPTSTSITVYGADFTTFNTLRLSNREAIVSNNPCDKCRHWGQAQTSHDFPRRIDATLTGSGIVTLHVAGCSLRFSSFVARLCRLNSFFRCSWLVCVCIPRKNERLHFL